MKDEITDIRMDSVVVCGTPVKRPSRVPRSLWMWFWEAVAWRA